MATSLAPPELPPLLAGAATPEQTRRAASFYGNVAELLELWVARCPSGHTRRAYRGDLMSFIGFAGIPWPVQAFALLRTRVEDVQHWRAHLEASGAAPKTLNRRVASLSSFFQYLGAAAAELRLPLTVPNPASAQFVARAAADPREERRALSLARARQLLAQPSGESALDYRDRAILKFYLSTGARLSTGCQLKVSDFHQDADGATIRLHEKGGRRRTIGLHYNAAQAIAEYIERATIERGPLFRPRLNSRSQKLAARAMDPATMYRVIQSYLDRLPGGRKEIETIAGRKTTRSVYTPHSLRATAATLLLDAGEDIRKVQELLGHRQITTTQVYDKRRRSTKESASHNIPL